MTLQNTFFGKGIIPLSYYLKGDLRFKYFGVYKRNLSMSKKEIKEFRLARFKKLIHHAYNTVPFYRELFNKLNLKPEDFVSVKDLKKLPVLDKKTILNNLEKLKSNKKHHLIKTFSGGSTGNKVFVFKDKRYNELSSGVWMRDLFSVGILPGMKSAWIWGDTFQNQGFWKKLVHNLSFRINRRIMFNVFKYTDDDLEFWLRNKFNNFKPDYIYGYAGIIYDIARFIKKKNIKIHRVKKIITTSERLENRKFIEKVFNCKVIDQYGCSEVTAVAIEDDNYVMHSDDDFVIVELNDDNEILLTPLESYGMPLFRYKVGDVGLIKKKSKEMNKSLFNEFNIIVGRIYEILKNKKGEKISGGLIKQLVEDENLEIGAFQLIQKSIDKVILNVVNDEFIKVKDVKRLKQIVKKVLGCSLVKINYVNKFPVESSGKRIAFKCEMMEDSK